MHLLVTEKIRLSLLVMSIYIFLPTQWEIHYQQSRKGAQKKYPEKFSHCKNRPIGFKQQSQLILYGQYYPVVVYKGVSW